MVVVTGCAVYCFMRRFVLCYNVSSFAKFIAYHIPNESSAQFLSLYFKK